MKTIIELVKSIVVGIIWGLTVSKHKEKLCAELNVHAPKIILVSHFTKRQFGALYMGDGFYDTNGVDYQVPPEGVIIVSISYIASLKISEAKNKFIELLAHEMRHCYQYNIGELKSDSINLELANNTEEYNNQPLEADAIAYGKEYLKRVA